MKIRELLNSPEKWTQGASAKDSRGFGVPARSPYARQWCLMGALDICYPEVKDAVHVQNRIALILGTSAIDWNDTPDRKFEEVKELVDKLNV